jgi:hypothetical protein
VPKLTRSKAPEPPPPHWIARFIKAPAVLAVIWPLLLVVGGYVAWHKWGAERIGKQFYRLDQAVVEINTPPDYIKTDIVSEVFHTHQLERISLLDKMATAFIGEAFKTHPWVQQVLRVEKQASGVQVQVRYRHPVAMVRVTSEHPDVQGDGLFPIDSEGVFLPVKDFQTVDYKQFLQIEVEGAYYPRVDGTPYGDDRVIAAAKLAEVLLPIREQSKLVTIRLANPRRTFDEGWMFVLIRSDGTLIDWGSPPGNESPGEPTSEYKIKRLLAQATST